MLDLRISE